VRQALEQGASQADRAQAADEAAARLRELIGIPPTPDAGVIVPQDFSPEGIPPQAVDISIAFFVTIAAIIIGLPIARAIARRLDRKSQTIVENADVSPRLDRIEQAIEAVAIEVERVSENQRYTTRILAELRSLPAPNPLEAWPAAGRHAQPEVGSVAPDRGRP
jgi:hypothetical protein